MRFFPECPPFFSFFLLRLGAKGRNLPGSFPQSYFFLFSLNICVLRSWTKNPPTSGGGPTSKSPHVVVVLN
jgi:hypothetical protein